MTHADERNLCWKRRKYQEVQWLKHLTKGERRKFHRLVRPMGVASRTVRRKAGSYRSLSSLSLELRNSETAQPDRGAKMPARRTEGGGSVVIEGRAAMARTG